MSQAYFLWHVAPRTPLGFHDCQVSVLGRLCHHHEHGRLILNLLVKSSWGALCIFCTLNEIKFPSPESTRGYSAYRLSMCPGRFPGHSLSPSQCCQEGNPNSTERKLESPWGSVTCSRAHSSWMVALGSQLPASAQACTHENVPCTAQAFCALELWKIVKALTF